MLNISHKIYCKVIAECKHKFVNKNSQRERLTVRGTAVTGTVLLAIWYRDFCVHIIMLPPPTFKRNVIFAQNIFPHVTDLSVDVEGLSLHVIMRCMTILSTLNDDTYHLTVYTEIPSSTRDASYRRRSYVTGNSVQRLDETSSYRDYGKLKLMPSLTSYLVTPTVTPTKMRQLNRSYIGGEKKIRTSMVIIDTSNGHIFLLFFFLLVDFLERMPWSYSKIWVNSWQWKWKNPFFACMAGLTVGSQPHSRDLTNIWYGDIVYLVSYRKGIPTGNQGQVWYWRNKSHAITFSRTLAHNYFFSRPTSHFPLFLDRAMCACSMHTTDESSIRRLLHRIWRGKRRNNMEYIVIQIWDYILNLVSLTM